MTVYEIYSFDGMDGYEFIGILPERRKSPQRITPDSIINWGRLVLGNQTATKGIYFKRITIENRTGRMYWVPI